MNYFIKYQSGNKIIKVRKVVNREKTLSNIQPTKSNESQNIDQNIEKSDDQSVKIKRNEKTIE